MAESLSQCFEESSLKYSRRTAIQWKKDGKWIDISYEGLKNNVESRAAFLSGKQIKKGDRVAILLENGPEWSAIFFAILALGAIAVPINPAASPKEVENILADSGAKLLLDNPEPPQPTRLRRFRNLVGCGGSGGSVSEHDTACILYTSGTTAHPKGVMLSHGNLLSNCGSLRRLNVITGKDSIFSVLPLHHAYSMTVTMLLPLLSGSKIIYPGSMRGEDISQAMKELNPTVFVAVPQIYYQFHKKIKEQIKSKRGLNLAYSSFLLRPLIYFGIRRKFGKRMRLFVSGGAKLDEGVEKDLFKFGFTISEGYGLTETSPVLTLNPLKKPKIGSVGLPVPDVELKIINKDKKERGEVIARGPNIMKGYYKREDLTADAVKDGWFHTGDLGYMDEDGYLFLTGRSKDIIVLSSGLNISPEEIEEAYLEEVPAKEMCVFEVPAKKGMKESHVLWAVVRPDLEFFKKYGEVNLKNVIKERFDNVSRTLPAAKRLMGFSITLDAFPRTLLGKIKRFEVKEIYTPKILKEEEAPEAGELSEEDRKLRESAAGKAIIGYLKKQSGLKGEIRPDNTLELDLGIDSLGRIELGSGLEKALGIKIPDEVIGRSFTVRDLILGLSHCEIPPQPRRLRKTSATYEVAEVPEVAKGSPDYWKKTLEELPSKECLDKIDLKPGFWAWFWCFIFVCLLKAFFKVFSGLRVEGAENVPKKGPFIVYVNHTSYFDGFLVGAALPKSPRLDLFFVGFRPYFEVPVTHSLVKIGRIIPLDFSTHLLEALRSCYYVLKNKKELCLFPEGLRTLNGNIAEFKPGFGILAKESGVRLVPVYLEGAFEAWPRTSKFPKRHPITVKFGKPLDIEEAEKQGLEAGAKDSYAAICLSARRHLTDLVGA